MRLNFDRALLRKLAVPAGIGVLAAAVWLVLERKDDFVVVGKVNAGEASRESVAVPAPARPVGAARLDLARLERPRAQEVTGDLFDLPRALAPPPPVAVVAKPEPPPPPKPPALPFAYLGQMTEKGQLKVFLGAGQETYTVKAGDTVRDVYRVESIGASGVVLTYLPMKMQQTLVVAPQQ